MSSYQTRLLEAVAKGRINPHIKYAPRGAAAKGLFSVAPEVLLSGPAGTGKSRAILEKLNFCANSYPGSRYLIVRKTRESLAESVLQTYESFVMGLNHPIVQGMKRHYRQSYYYPNGSQIVVGGMNKADRIMSTEYDIIYVQEATELSIEDWEKLSTRLRNRKLPFQQIIGDCNPAAPTHWLKQRCDRGATLFLDTRHEENPLLWDAAKGEWTPEGVRYLARLDQLSGARKQRLRYGLWVQPAGAIYDVFDDTRHKVKSFTPPALWPRIVGIDPIGQITAALWLAYDPQAEVLNVYREYYEPFGRTTAGNAERILQLSRGETIFAWAGGGPSENQARLDWAASGIPLMECPVFEVWAGIDRVYSLMKDFKLVVHDCCTHLLDEIGGYRRKLKDDVPTDAIENKDEMHALDSLRYAIGYLTGGKTERQVVDVTRRIGAY
jgi:hypothetical protein